MQRRHQPPPSALSWPQLLLLAAMSAPASCWRADDVTTGDGAGPPADWERPRPLPWERQKSGQERQPEPEQDTQPEVHQLTLDEDNNIKLYWVLDYSASEVELQVQAADLQQTQWLAVGFSGNGTLAGAELCLLWTDWRRHTHVQHGWVEAHGRFSVDGQHSCWGAHVTRAGPMGHVTGFRYRRPFNTCRPGDYVLEWGTTHVVWVTGGGPLLSAHRLQLSHFPAGFSRVQLLRAQLVAGRPPSSGAAARDVTLTSVNVTVPAVETTYWCTVHKLPDDLVKKHHIVQYAAVIEAGNEALVHHMEVFHCEAPADEQLPAYEGPCHAAHRPPQLDRCKRVLAAWAMGATPLVYPEEAGLPIGGEDFNLYVMLEVHYNNPKLVAGHVDSSGVRLTYTNQLREHDAAVMELGLEYTDKMAIPPGQTHFTLTGFCVAECTAIGLPVDGIRVFASQLHTHLTGVSVRTNHVRSDGTQLPDLNVDPHYSSHFQEIRILPQQRQVLPGDALITSCVYRTAERGNVTLGGFSISDEMCVNYIHYFPKVDLEVCKSSVDSQTLIDYFGFLREWEDQETGEELGWGDNYRRINWTRLRAHGLAELYASAPLSMQCNQSDGSRFAGYWESIPQPVVLDALPELDECASAQHDAGL